MRLHKESCYGCRFAIEARNHVRHGEQVRCGWAEQEFGGVRWVDVRKGKSGKVLKSQCGQFQPFQGDDSRVPEPKKEKELKRCDKCSGSGILQVQFMMGPQKIKCHYCGGKGLVN